MKAGQRPVVLTPNPLYQVYAGAAIMAGAELVPVPATRDTGFLPDFESLPPRLLERCALAYLCSPSNPEGAVADRARLARLVQLARKHGFVLAADHCYADIYDRVPPPSALEACASLGGGADGVIVFHSLSKRSSVPGLRSGFVAGAKDVIAAFARLRAYAGATTPVPIAAAAAALWRDEAHVDANRALYRAKFDIAERIIDNRFGFYRPAGGFYLWLDVGNGETAARTLWTKAGVRTLPGAYLARDQANGENPGARYIRVSLVDDLPAVKAGLERLADVL
jgi:N-succinyldiaminopimelate aminotransferase